MEDAVGTDEAEVLIPKLHLRVQTRGFYGGIDERRVVIDFIQDSVLIIDVIGVFD